MSRLLVLPAVLACLTSSPVFAIDCVKAAQAFEKAICADPKLTAADGELNRFYFDRLRSLTGEAHDLLQADQRHWVEERGSKCSPITASCLAKAIVERRRDLAVCSRSAWSPSVDPENKAICLYYQHPGCPRLYAWGSANLVRYPFLKTQLIDELKGDFVDFNCGKGQSTTPAQTDGASVMTIVEAERPGLAFVYRYDDGCRRSWGKCFGTESLDATDVKTKDVVSFSSLFADAPPLKIYTRFLPYIEGHLSMRCCGDNAKDGTATLEDLQIDGVDHLPDGWSVTPAGDLVVAYQYKGAGHTFLSRATIPRAAFINIVVPKYTALFDPHPH